MFTSFTTTRNSSQSSIASASKLSSPQQTSEHLFGELASAYGFNGGVPSLPSRSSSPSPKTSRCIAPQFPTTSTAVSVPSPSPKNYEESYGLLASTTAFGAGVPSSTVHRAQKKLTSNTATSTPLTISRVSSSQSSSSHKDYEHGFGQLAASYDFGHAGPSFSMSK
ncbi:hypothetical protein BJ165DRAFT_1528544 [Panaeolus papilionaceus]|nr:hypothetical protein BJ165DRAFT_1528544 [Panaeolus papilionaceus]